MGKREELGEPQFSTLDHGLHCDAIYQNRRPDYWGKMLGFSVECSEIDKPVGALGEMSRKWLGIYRALELRSGKLGYC